MKSTMNHKQSLRPNGLEQRTTNQMGQVLVLALVIVGLVMINTLVIVSGSQIFSQNTNYTVQASQALNLAEAGVDKALASLNATGGSYNGEPETLLGGGSYSVTITTPNTTTKVIESTGYIPSKDNPKAKRTIKINAGKGVGISFVYGVQVGEGGLQMAETSKVDGSVYSNGNIEMDNNAKITGDAYVAGGTEAIADQQSDCTPPNCTDFIFGKNVAGDDRLDIAQSFRLSSSSYLGKVELKLKKIGSPSDITVRVMEDKNGKPDKGNVLTSGTLAASLVTGQYGFPEVAFDTAPYLSSNTTYWIMLDTSLNASNYWAWSADSLQGYTGGSPSWSPDWQAGNPAWNAISADLGFKVYLGGVPTHIQGGNNGSTISGNAYANTLRNLTVGGGAYYQMAENVSAGSNHPDSTDPTPKTMPISDANIAAWKTAASEAGVYSGNISSCRSQLGPGQYVGNVTFPVGCIVMIIDPVWITGNLRLNNGAELQLDASYGSTSGVVIADGTIELSQNNKILSLGTPGSYLMAISTYDSRTNGVEAIVVENSSNDGILYAPYGIAKIENTNAISELTAWKVKLLNGVIITYDTGLSSAYFSSGPSGAYSLVKGTYQLK